MLYSVSSFFLSPESMIIFHRVFMLVALFTELGGLIITSPHMGKTRGREAKYIDKTRWS